MLRSYRCIIIAVAGLILIGASPSKQGNTNKEGDESSRPVASEQAGADTTAPKQPISHPPDKGCERGKDNRKSDLCAQWKAADAASDAAQYTYWQLMIGWIGVVLGSITMASAIAAALYAKRAAIATEATVGIAKEAAHGAEAALDIANRNADAAVKLADQAEQTAQRQLQAYAHISGAALHHGAGITDTHVLITIGNHGQTPARIKRLQVYIQWRTTNSVDLEPLGEHDARIDMSCYKDLPVRIPFSMKPPVDRGSQGQIVVEGCLYYTDVFNGSRASDFIFNSDTQKFFLFEDGHRFSYVADEEYPEAES